MRSLVIRLVLLVCCLFAPGIVLATEIPTFRTPEVTITVLDLQGRPVPGAVVRGWCLSYGHWQPWNRWSVSKTDAEGKIKFKMVEGDWSVVAASEGMCAMIPKVTVTPDTRALTVQPDTKLAIHATDLDGKPLGDAEVLAYPATFKPAYPFAKIGTIRGGVCSIAVTKGQNYGLVIGKVPNGNQPALALHVPNATGSVNVDARKLVLRGLALENKGVNGKTADLVFKVYFPELSWVHEYSGNPGVWTLDVKGSTRLLTNIDYVGMEATQKIEGWSVKFFPQHLVMSQENGKKLAYGGVFSIHPQLYLREGMDAQVWRQIEDADRHPVYDINNPSGRQQTADVVLYDKDKAILKTIKLSDASATADHQYGSELVSWSVDYNYGPFGAGSVSGDPRAPEYALKLKRLESNNRWELLAPDEPYFKSQAAIAFKMMNEAWDGYKKLYGLEPDTRRKPITLYFEPNLGNAGGITYGDLEISVWLQDLLLYTAPHRNPADHITNILFHEFFHVEQDVTRDVRKGRNFYLDSWFGESINQVYFNRLHGLLYGKMAQKLHQGVYFQEFLEKQAGEHSHSNIDGVWDTMATVSGDAVLKRFIDVVGSPNWPNWDWMMRSGIDEKAAVVGIFNVFTGKDWLPTMLLTGTPISRNEVDLAAKLTLSKTPDGPNKCLAPFLIDWLVLGPFPGGKEGEFFRSKPSEDEGQWLPKVGMDTLGKTWRTAKSDSNGRLSLGTIFGGGFDSCAYVSSTFESKQSCDGYVWFGVDDAAKIWLNGQLIYSKFTRQGATPDYRMLPVKLLQGVNRVVVKVDNGEGEWELYMRFSDQKGMALAK
jgi:hypothetical protein